MQDISDFPKDLSDLLLKRRKDNLFRQLYNSKDLIDFCSNDYLGYSRSSTLQNLILQKLKFYELKNGSTGSRLISGNTKNIELLEDKIASFHRAESGLIFNSGYDANLGLLSSIGKKEDVFLFDELAHASLHDGMRLSLSKRFKFKHNDLQDLERLLQNNLTKGNVYVIVESVYSMDGDLAPLKEITELKRKHNFYLIVDEAHATGVIGTEGRGLCNTLNLESICFARIHTFGKALGVHGAIILGSHMLRDYLINFSRSFIYTTALSPHAYASIDASYDYLIQGVSLSALHENINYFYETTQTSLDIKTTKSAIQTVHIQGNEKVSQKSQELLKSGMDVRAIKSPTVKLGEERLRICLHSFNSFQEIDKLIHLLQ